MLTFEEKKAMSDSKKKVGTPSLAISRKKLVGEAPIIVNELLTDCLYSGFFGTLDSSRMKSVIDSLLAIVNASDHEYLIVDLSNVDIIDSIIAGHLIKMTKTLRMLGLSVIYCGIKPIVAQSMISAGIDISDNIIVKNMKTALKEVLKRKGLKIVPIDK